MNHPTTAMKPFKLNLFQDVSNFANDHLYAYYSSYSHKTRKKPLRTGLSRQPPWPTSWDFAFEKLHQLRDLRAVGTQIELQTLRVEQHETLLQRAFRVFGWFQTFRVSSFCWGVLVFIRWVSTKKRILELLETFLDLVHFGFKRKDLDVVSRVVFGSVSRFITTLKLKPFKKPKSYVLRCKQLNC